MNQMAFKKIDDNKDMKQTSSHNKEKVIPKCILYAFSI